MKEYLIELTPRSSFEVQIHSDTLFGAICWAIRILYDEKKLLELISLFTKSDEPPPFLISSAFPCCPERGLYYVPKPYLNPLTAEELKKLSQKYASFDRPYNSPKRALIEIINRYKEFRKMNWVDFDVLNRHISNLSEIELFVEYLDGFLIESKFKVTEAVQKNSLDRLVNSTVGSGNTFFNIENYFREGWHLYFFIKISDFVDYIFSALKFLEDSGIGSNSKTGKNWFNIEIKENPFSFSETGTHFITLSRFIRNESIIVGKSFYTLTRIRSKVESREEFAGEDIWKSEVTYFKEGSVICPKHRNRNYGGLFPVKNINGKTIYQYGFAYPFWINMEVEDAI